ncbi:hypothetical protein M8C21_016722, partial [Ambrosia artemisiifolia]
VLIRRGMKMFSWVGKLAFGAKKDDKLDDDKDPLIWCKDLEKHAFGELSYAVVQANEVVEDHSQVEIGQKATFVGVYDGHGGQEASRYISNHLFPHLIRIVREKGLISTETLKNAVSATEEGFMSLVHRSCGIKPLMMAVGSCCLAGIISEGTLYVANMGDSRAVIGRLKRHGSNKIVAEQITEDHNACADEIRQELKQNHPDEPHIVVMRQGVWRIKGLIQGIARRLINLAIKEAAQKGKKYYEEVKMMEKGCRRGVHDDITVVVVFIDQQVNIDINEASMRGFAKSTTTSSFSTL